MGRGRGTPRWDDDPVQKRDEWCWQIGQDMDSPSEGSRKERGVEMGEDNTYITINDISYVRSIH